MRVGPSNPRQLFEKPDTVAFGVPSSELFGFLRRSIQLPVEWAGVVTRTTGDECLVPAGGSVERDDAEFVFFARTTPVEAHFVEEGLLTRDGFRCTGEVRMRFQPRLDRGELASLQRTLLGSQRALTVTGLRHYFQGSVRDALVRVAEQFDAAELIGKMPESIVRSMRQAVEPLSFSAGLSVEDPMSLRFASDAYHQALQSQEESMLRRRENEAARLARESVARDQSQHLNHLNSLIARLTDLAKASPGVGLPEMLRSFSEQQRAEIYEALFASESPVPITRWVVVAVGDELLFFDPRRFGTPQRRLRVEGGAGPVRSVQYGLETDGSPILWLGALTGIYRLPLDRAEPDLELFVPGSPSVRGGFNSVAAQGGRVWASHSELGLWEWSVRPSGAGRRLFEDRTRGAEAVRAVQSRRDKWYCAVGALVLIGSADDAVAEVLTGSRSVLTALCLTAHGVLAGNSEGDVLYWPLGKPADPVRLSTGSRRPAESVCSMSVQGVERVFYTDTSMHVHARVLGDSFACRYEAGGQTLRRVEVAEDLVVATNELRDRLICWRPAQPAKPIETIAVAALCGRSIQDACLVPNASGPTA